MHFQSNGKHLIIEEKVTKVKGLRFYERFESRWISRPVAFKKRTVRTLNIYISGKYVDF